MSFTHSLHCAVIFYHKCLMAVTGNLLSTNSKNWVLNIWHYVLIVDWEILPHSPGPHSKICGDAPEYKTPLLMMSSAQRPVPSDIPMCWKELALRTLCCLLGPFLLKNQTGKQNTYAEYLRCSRVIVLRILGASGVSLLVPKSSHQGVGIIAAQRESRCT